jgi:hypothetical protein
MLGHDISPATAQMSARETGHEIAGTPISSFISREELNEHIRMMHPGQRFPTRTHRRIGRGQTQPITVNVTQTQTAPETQKTPPSTATIEDIQEEQPSTETREEMAETEAEGEGFTDDDDQVFDGDGGLLDWWQDVDANDPRGNWEPSPRRDVRMRSSSVLEVRVLLAMMRLPKAKKLVERKRGSSFKKVIWMARRKRSKKERRAIAAKRRMRNEGFTIGEGYGRAKTKERSRSKDYGGIF